MRRTEEERMIDRYHDNVMGPDERLAFEQRLASDAEFAATYRAEVLIRRTLAKDRLAIPTDHSKTRNRVLGVLSTVPGGMVAPVAGGGFGLGSLAASKLATIVAAALGIVGSTMLLTSSHEPENRLRLPAPGMINMERAIPPPVSEPAVTTEERSAGDAVPAQREAARAVPAGMQPAARTEEQLDDETRSRGSADAGGATVISSDSVRMKLKLDLKKIHKQETP
ncbi:MAG: hypothetical protein IPP94_15295 [Ignavibacteria bacterium]|nr:hypothetical protein [Ignavibacteria bacterium]